MPSLQPQHIRSNQPSSLIFLFVLCAGLALTGDIESLWLLVARLVHASSCRSLERSHLQDSQYIRSMRLAEVVTQMVMTVRHKHKSSAATWPCNPQHSSSAVGA